jgi:mannose-6-phosphate isomerase-like protein (cupin superfamily)
MSGDAKATYVAENEGKQFRFAAGNVGEVKANGASGLHFGFFRSTLPRGAGMPFLHVHRTYEEAFHIVDGEVEYRLDNVYVTATRGGSVIVPPGVAHCFRSTGPVDARLVVITAPAVAVDMIEELAVAGLGANVDRMAEILARHDSLLLERHPHWRSES